jgi:hypothetical protein
MLVLLPQIRNKWIADFSHLSDPLKEPEVAPALQGNTETKLLCAP